MNNGRALRFIQTVLGALFSGDEAIADSSLQHVEPRQFEIVPTVYSPTELPIWSPTMATTESPTPATTRTADPTSTEEASTDRPTPSRTDAPTAFPSPGTTRTAPPTMEASTESPTPPTPFPSPAIAGTPVPTSEASNADDVNADEEDEHNGDAQAPYEEPYELYPTYSPTEAPTYENSRYYPRSPTEEPSYWYDYMSPTDTPYFRPTTYPSPWFDYGCNIDADLYCTTSSGQNCNYLSVPSDFVCDSFDGNANSVSFLVTGNSCGSTPYCNETFPYRYLEEQQYYVFVHHDREILFQGVVQPGSVFTFDPAGCGVVSIDISTVPVGYPRPGLPLQMLSRVPLSCLGTEKRDLSLMQDFGALQVVGFSNRDQGVQSIVEEIVLTYTIYNYGMAAVTVDEAITQTDFDFQLLDLMEDCEDPVLSSGEQMSFESKPYVINIGEHYYGSYMYMAFLDVMATSLDNQYDSCFDRVRLGIEVTTETRAPYYYFPTDPPTPWSWNTAPPSLSYTTEPESEIRMIVSRVALNGGREWVNETSYQASAIRWLEEDKLAYELAPERIWQRYSLACIYFATYAVPNAHTVPQPRGWINSTGWLDPTSECSWYGINCTRDSLVESINLASNRVTGSFPPETVLLAESLVRLDLFRNSVHNKGDEGHMWLPALYNLQFLYYGQTNFEYDYGIPFYLMELFNLRDFDCSNTLYKGALDGEVFMLWQNMEWMSIGGNSYNGTIPYEIGFMPNLQFLYMENANFVGGLYFLDGMEAPLTELWMGKNPGLGGTIPTTIGYVSSLQSLSLSGCSLSGTIPTDLAQLRELRFLWVFDNYLSGTIPAEMADLYDLQVLEVEENMLTGVMPDAICGNRMPAGGMLATLEADCGGAMPEIECSCCTCCESCTLEPILSPIEADAVVDAADSKDNGWPRRR